MANNIVKSITMSRAKELVGNLAQTNHYLVSIPIPEKVKTHIQKSYPEDTRSSQVPKFVTEKLGLLCSDASLPTSSYATAEVKDNFMGITQEFAHTRLYTDLDFTFYVDNDYTVMRFFEGWMDYISGGGEFAAASDPSTSGFRRFNFPNDYKVQNMEIFKFEKDYKTVLSYQFVNAFPKGLTPVPISYGDADLLKVTVNFNYDRYLVKRGFTKEFDLEIRKKALTTKEPFKDERIPGTTIFPAGIPLPLDQRPTIDPFPQGFSRDSA